MPSGSASATGWTTDPGIVCSLTPSATSITGCGANTSTSKLTVE
jgi:hypothetical protein